MFPKTILKILGTLLLLTIIVSGDLEEGGEKKDDPNKGLTKTGRQYPYNPYNPYQYPQGNYYPRIFQPSRPINYYDEKEAGSVAGGLPTNDLYGQPPWVNKPSTPQQPPPQQSGGTLAGGQTQHDGAVPQQNFQGYFPQAFNIPVVFPPGCIHIDQYGFGFLNPSAGCRPLQAPPIG